MHVERVQQLVQSVRVVEIPVSVLVQHNLLSDEQPNGLKPIGPAKVRGVVEDRLRGGKVSVDRRDVVRLVGVQVEVVAQIGQAERVYSVSNPAKRISNR